MKTQIIMLELESIKINKQLIADHSGIDLKTCQIIVDNARASIKFSQEVILTMAKLKAV